MAKQIILADTSLLIHYFRKSDKSKSRFFSLYQQGYDFCISAITEFDIYTGTTTAQIPFWQVFLENTNVLPFDKRAVSVAVTLSKELKLKNKLIDLADLFIAATAIANELPLATLNKKHFDRLSSLQILE